MSTRLDHVIRKYLTEQTRPTYKYMAKKPDADSTNFIKNKICPLFKIDPSTVGVASSPDPKKTWQQGRLVRIDGLEFQINRRNAMPAGQTDPFSTADSSIKQATKLRTLLQSYMNTGLAGVWQKATSTGWFWFISTDQNLDNKKESFKKKDTRTFAKYVYVCTYVKSDVFPPSLSLKITSATKGYMFTLNDGALVFDLAEIDAAQWKIMTPKTYSGDDAALLSSPGVPQSIMSFGNYNADGVSALNYYLGISNELESNAEFKALQADFPKYFISTAGAVEDGETNQLPDTYTCVQQEFIRVLQDKASKAGYSINVNGQYDIATINYLNGRKDKNNNVLPYYRFDDADIPSIINKIRTCLGSQPAAVTSSEIQVPEGGFKKNQTNDPDNFGKVQDLLLNAYIALNKKNPEFFPLNASEYTNLKNALAKTPSPRGGYGDRTQALALYIADGIPDLKNTTKLKNNIIDADVIRILKKITDPTVTKTIKDN